MVKKDQFAAPEDDCEAGGREAATNEETLGVLSLSLDQVLASFPGPALIVDEYGRLIAANIQASTIAHALRQGTAGRLDALIMNATSSRKPISQNVDIPGESGGAAFEAALLPFDDRSRGRQVLVLARETTVERNFTNALVASRGMFKDLVMCSSDFAWETREDGTFGFVSPRGALDFSPRDLNGRSVRSLIHPDHPIDGPLPFECDVPMDGVEVWLTAANGLPACLLVSAVPVFDEAGAWLGARGGVPRRDRGTPARCATRAGARPRAAARRNHRLHPQRDRPRRHARRRCRVGRGRWKPANARSFAPRQAASLNWRSVRVGRLRGR